MGLFNKNKNADEINSAENTELSQESTQESTEKTAASRRFSLVVEGVTSMLDGDGVIVSGELFGTVNKDDEVYIYIPGTETVTCHVVGIETKIDDRMTIADEASDAFTTLQLDINDTNLVKKYAVISNVLSEKLEVGKPILNPALEGIINGMAKFGKDNTFHGTVAYWLSHAHLITPVKMEKTEEENKAKVGFYMLKSNVRLAGVEEGKDSLVLPLFTDGLALSRWKGLSKDGEQIRTQILRFQDVIRLLKNGNAYAGIVVNPFNKVPATLPIPYLDTITSTPGYKRDFGEMTETESEGHVKEQQIKKDTKILLGAPKDTKEVREIKDLLAAYGEDSADIKSINLMVKVEEEKKIVRYLILLEMDAEGDAAKAHMESIYQQLKPLANEIKAIEYAIKGRIPAIDKVAEEHKDQMLVYEA